MASTLEAPATGSRKLPGRRYDRYFFSGMVLLILGVVLVGFAPKYYLAGVFRAPLPSPFIHIHAAVNTAWILLLVVQTGLVSAGRVAVHRRLGVAGFCLAVVVPIAGFLAMASQLHFKGNAPGRDMLAFSAVSFEGIFLFAVLATMAYATRLRDPAAHKRYIVLATIGMIDAALFRLNVPLLHRQLTNDYLAIGLLVVLMAVYDLWSTRKVNRATLFGGIFVIVVQQLTMPIGATAGWHSFARWVQSWNL